MSGRDWMTMFLDGLTYAVVVWISVLFWFSQ